MSVISVTAAVSNMSVLCLLTLALAFVPQLSATAVPIPRPGCPPYTPLSPQELSVRLCRKECTTDRNCKDNKICCFDGCSNVCVPRMPSVKDGVCPKPILVKDPRVVRCLSECTSDCQCPDDKKCCKNACGHLGICVTPKKVPKQGCCPKPVGFGICVNLCSTDHDCKKNLKCCSNNCGKICMKPVMKKKRGWCPAPFTRSDCNREDKCNNDCDCKGGLKCCFDGCEKICRKPLEKKTGTCPKPIPHFAECDATCDNDDKCEGGLLCCFSGCGLECLKPEDQQITKG